LKPSGVICLNFSINQQQPKLSIWAGSKWPQTGDFHVSLEWPSVNSIDGWARDRINDILRKPRWAIASSNPYLYHFWHTQTQWNFWMFILFITWLLRESFISRRGIKISEWKRWCFRNR